MGLFLRIFDPLLSQGKRALALSDGRRVIHFTDPSFPASFLEPKAGVGCVCDNVPPDGLRVVLSKAHSVGVCDNLVCQHHSESIVVRQALELPQELGEVLLPLRELSAPREVCPEVRCRRVNDKEDKPVLGHQSSGLLKEFHLLLGVVRSGENDVLENLFWIHPIPLSDGDEPVWAKAAFRVDVHGLSLGESEVTMKAPRGGNEEQGPLSSYLTPTLV
mmetsp:Transcript_65484/g.147743  ORF Transcript_65484/g.147743 Transcript_65484/m.147743 type:complete len:218 (-) Transcript_65484:18-671(-)